MLPVFLFRFKLFLIRVVHIKVKIFLPSGTALRRCSSRLRFLFPSLLCRLFAVCGGDKVVQLPDNNLVVLRALIRARLDILEIPVNRIQTLKQQIDHGAVHFYLIASDLLKHVLHIMCQMLHSFKTHSARHPL